MVTSAIQVTQSHFEAFRSLSGDENPLHTQPIYAKRSQFGQPVLYGVCSTLLALGEWAGSKNFALKKIRMQFKAPIFLNDALEFKILSSQGSQVKLGVLSGTQVQSIIDLDWIQCESPDPWPEDLIPHARELGLEPGILPLSQLKAMLWASYYTGMKVPGDQALLLEVEIKFSDNRIREFAPGEMSSDFDSRFNQVLVRGVSLAGDQFTLKSFKRPPPVEYTDEQLMSALKPQKLLEATRILITGATRGFGSVLSQMAALQGAHVYAHYRDDVGQASLLKTKIEARGGKCSLVRAELTSKPAMDTLKELGEMDWLVNNAFPHIRPRYFLEQSSEEFLDFVQTGLATVLHPTRPLLPSLKRGVVMIGSVFTSEPRAQFSHYIAAKSAINGLTAAIAHEFPSLQFILAQAPRMLTDQTNLAYHSQPPAQATHVAAQLLLEMARTQDIPTGFREIEIS